MKVQDLDQATDSQEAEDIVQAPEEVVVVVVVEADTLQAEEGIQ